LISNSPKPLLSIVPINSWEINEYLMNLGLNLMAIQRRLLSN
jgi:hypothetical protein